VEVNDGVNHPMAAEAWWGIYATRKVKLSSRRKREE
jgi:hypothetical protein